MTPEQNPFTAITNSPELTHHFEESAQSIARSVRPRSKEERETTLDILVTGVISRLQQGIAKDIKRLLEDFRQVNVTALIPILRSEVLRILQEADTKVETPTVSDPTGRETRREAAPEWEPNDYHDKKLLQAFFEELDKHPKKKSAAIGMAANKQKLMVNGKLLDVDALFSAFKEEAIDSKYKDNRPLNPSVGYVEILDYIQKYCTTDEEDESKIESRRQFLRSKDVVTAFLKDMYNIRFVVDFSTEEGQERLAEAYLGLKQRLHLSDTRLNKRSIDVAGRQGGIEHIGFREISGAWDVQAIQEARTLQNLTDEMCVEAFGFKLSALLVDRREVKKRPDDEDQLKDWGEADFKNPKNVKAAVAQIFGIKNPNWSHSAIQQTMIQAPLNDLKSCAVVRIKGYEPISFVQILNAWCPNDDLAAWMKILMGVFKIPDVINRRRRLMPPGPGRTALERLIKKED